MKKIYLIIILILLSFQIMYAQAPDIEWQNTIGGDKRDFLKSILQTSDGGYILGGYSKSSISNDKSEPSSSWDYWVVKIDEFGEVLWENTIGGDKDDFLKCIVQVDDGGYLLGGNSISGISGDKTEEVISIYLRDDFWIVRLDEDGNILWDKTIGTNGFDWLNVIHKTEDGGYLLGGTSSYDYSTIKIDSLGNIIWWKTFGGGMNDYLYSVDQTVDRGYILGGYSASGISVDKTEESRGLNDYWVIKLDELGNKIWDKTIGGNVDDFLYSIQQTNDGGYILGGTSNSEESGEKTEPRKGWDYWVVKINHSGDIEWQNTIGGTDHSNDWLKNVQQVSDGGYILGGYSPLFSPSLILILGHLGEAMRARRGLRPWHGIKRILQELGRLRVFSFGSMRDQAYER